MEQTPVEFYYERNEFGEDLTYDFATNCGSIYFHGELEEQIGFDLPYYNKEKLPKEDGIYPANVNDNSGYTLYFWRHQLTAEYIQLRGLIVKDNDIESAKYAANRFNERTSYL